MHSTEGGGGGGDGGGGRGAMVTFIPHLHKLKLDVCDV